MIETPSEKRFNVFSPYVFTQDYLFASPSTATGVVVGRSANGRIEWQTKDGRSLKAVQEAEAAE